jgi:hypothetical protein
MTPTLPTPIFNRDCHVEFIALKGKIAEPYFLIFIILILYNMFYISRAGIRGGSAWQLPGAPTYKGRQEVTEVI